MARTKSPAVAKRNDVIFAEWRRGASLTGLAAKHGISRQVVGRIVASFHPELEEDTDRALYRGCLWRLYDEMGEVLQDPGYKLSPSGGPARGPDGEPAIDTNTKIQAGELQMKIIGELRKMDARDKPAKPPPMPQDQAWQQAQLALAAAKSKMDLDAADRQELEAFRRQREGAVPGEVIRELPPGQEDS